jgi:hypothetical protein
MAATTAAGRPRSLAGVGMGIRSWFRSLRSGSLSSGDVRDDGPQSLIRYRYEDPVFEPVEEAAAADVAAVEEDAKYFGSDSPASQDEL